MTPPKRQLPQFRPQFRSDLPERPIAGDIVVDVDGVHHVRMGWGAWIPIRDEDVLSDDELRALLDAQALVLLTGAGQSVEAEQRKVAEERIRIGSLSAEVTVLTGQLLAVSSLAERAVEAAVDSALGEVRRQGGPDYLLVEAKNAGTAGAQVFLGAIAFLGTLGPAAELDRALNILATPPPETVLRREDIMRRWAATPAPAGMLAAASPQPVPMMLRRDDGSFVGTMSPSRPAPAGMLVGQQEPVPACVCGHAASAHRNGTDACQSMRPDGLECACPVYFVLQRADTARMSEVWEFCARNGLPSSCGRAIDACGASTEPVERLGYMLVMLDTVFCAFGTDAICAEAVALVERIRATSARQL